MALAVGQILCGRPSSGYAAAPPGRAPGGQPRRGWPRREIRDRPLKVPLVLSRAQPGVFDQGAGAVNLVGSPVSASIAAAPTAETPGMLVTSSVSPSSSSTSTMRDSTSVRRILAERQSVAPSERVPAHWPLGHHPLGSTRAVKTASMMDRRRRDPPQRQLAAHRGLKPRQTASVQPFRVAITALQHHRQRRTPVRGIKRVRRRLQHPRPGALQQITQLVHTGGGLATSRCRLCPNWRSRAQVSSAHSEA